MAERTKRVQSEPGGKEPPAAGEASVIAQLAALKEMTVGGLKAKWEAIFATSAPNNSRSYLELRLERFPI